MTVKVLANIDGALERLADSLGLDDSEELAGKCRDDETSYIEAYEFIYGEVSETVYDALEFVVSDTNDPDEFTTKPPKGSFLPGFLFPDELLAEAEGWNREIEGNLAGIIRDIRKEEARLGSLESLFADIPRYAMGHDGKDPEHIVLRLMHAAAEMAGEFIFGGPRLVLDHDMCGDISPSTGICPTWLESIRKNPEDYVIIEIDYD